MDHPRLDGALPAEFGGRHTDGDIGYDGPHRGHHEAGIGAPDALPHHLGHVGGEPGGHAVIPRVPQGDGGQQEDQAPLHRAGQHLAAAAVVLGQVPFRVLFLQRLVFQRQLRLPDGEQQHHHRHRHNARHNEEQGLVVHVLQSPGLFRGIEDHAYAQVDHAAHRAHQVDDGVALGAQGLGGDVGHQGHRRGAVGAHGDEQQAQHNDKARQLEGSGLDGVAVVQQGQQVHQHHRPGGARQDEGGAPAQLPHAALIGQPAEQGQQKQGQHIIRRHDHSGEGLVQREGAPEDQRHQIVVHLPERADGQKGKADQNRPFVVQLQFVHVTTLFPRGIFPRPRPQAA